MFEMHEANMAWLQAQLTAFGQWFAVTVWPHILTGLVWLNGALEALPPHTRLIAQIVLAVCMALSLDRMSRQFARGCRVLLRLELLLLLTWLEAWQRLVQLLSARTIRVRIAR